MHELSALLSISGAVNFEQQKWIDLFTIFFFLSLSSVTVFSNGRALPHPWATLEPVGDTLFLQTALKTVSNRHLEQHFDIDPIILLVADFSLGLCLISKVQIIKY